MSMRRVMPNIRSEAVQESREFYGLLGFEEVMNHGWIMTLASPSNPQAQISFMTADKTAPVDPDMSIEVDDVDAAYEVMREAGRRSCIPSRTRSGAYGASWSATPTAGSSTCSATADRARPARVCALRWSPGRRRDTCRVSAERGSAARRSRRHRCPPPRRSSPSPPCPTRAGTRAAYAESRSAPLGERGRRRRLRHVFPHLPASPPAESCPLMNGRRMPHRQPRAGRPHRWPDGSAWRRRRWKPMPARSVPEESSPC